MLKHNLLVLLQEFRLSRSCYRQNASSTVPTRRKILRSSAYNKNLECLKNITDIINKNIK